SHGLALRQVKDHLGSYVYSCVCRCVVGLLRSTFSPNSTDSRLGRPTTCATDHIHRTTTTLAETSRGRLRLHRHTDGCSREKPIRVLAARIVMYSGSDRYVSNSWRRFQTLARLVCVLRPDTRMALA